MTGTALSTTLGLRLEDTAETIFTAQMKMDAINSAQRAVVNLVHDQYLTELEDIKNNQSVSGGSVSFSSMSLDPIRNRILGVYDETNDKWATMIDYKDRKELDNVYLTPTSADAVVFVLNETIYVKPTSISQVDVWYLKKPTDYTYSDGTSMATPCELNPALYEPVLSYAEGILWRMDNKLNQANTANQSAIQQINVLNQRIQQDNIESIGTPK